ncbi:hypothetical protein CRP01_18375 [Flavilitoribacter nigricans DSM 23189 = NBRC 102662]|uniref:Transposase n=2 Tax=Flavilitoribacter TaxID=2762562 RepID=A0A2D0MZF0_FLAN2|nr:hypothetical protein CRP01_40315 [Flavilitoribacter nigricans DSM 23189 = NBRC 102662]PHN04997.1 hypothetical protein CRP01_18375 [Flavilitoribacter nigricans DSM 23189 = NBRC 102662]
MHSKNLKFRHMKKSKKTRSYLRERRYFSEDFRRSRVKEYDEGQTSVSEICRVYGVTKSAVYKWIKKYSPHYQKSITKVVEEKSETQKRLALEQKVKELEQFIGRQQVQLSYYEKLLATAEQRYNIELEKNSDWKSSNGFSHTDPNTK